MNKKINAITLGGIFAGCYGILTLLFSYYFPLLGTLAIFILPILCAYYSTKYSFKEILAFDLATAIVCLLIGISNIIYPLLYVIPSLIIGNFFGLFNKYKVKYYETIFYQSLLYCFINYLTIYITESFLNESIVKFFIQDPNIYENYSLLILYIVSLGESIITSLVVSEQLRRLKLNKEYEKEFPKRGYLIIFLLLALTIAFKFIDTNFYNLFAFLTILVSFISLVELINVIKHKYFFVVTLLISLFLGSFILISEKQESYIMLFISSAISLVSIVKFIIKFYNKKEV